MRLAIAESDAVTADLLAFTAQRRGHQAACVSSVEKLFERLPFEPSIVVASLESPGPSAVGFVERLRRHFPEAGLFMTVEKPKEPLPTAVLRAGATDVIRVPYNPQELLLRAEGWLAAHSSASATSESVRLGDLEVALDRYAAMKNGHALTLTKLELRLLYCLAEHHPHMAPIERLLTFGWDTLGDPDAALIKTHISHIRKKLAEAGGQPLEIISRQTLGYVLQVGS